MKLSTRTISIFNRKSADRVLLEMDSHRRTLTRIKGRSRKRRKLITGYIYNSLPISKGANRIQTLTSSDVNLKRFDIVQHCVVC